MDTQAKTQICNSCIESLIDRKPLTKDEEQHVLVCKECKAIINTMGAIALQGSAYNEDLSGIKHRLMKNLVPILPKENVINSKESSTLNRLIPWLLSFSVTGAMLLMFAILQPTTPVQINNSNNLIGKRIVAQSFQIAINSGKTEEISLDEPVTLTNTESAKITIPDGSILQVKGPAKLNINPRGFHLVEGFLTATVKKDKIPFISTTPHGQIRVLGTIYKCNTTRKETVVSLIKGSVKVIPDYGFPIILAPGETSTLSIKPDLAIKKKKIPPIDSE